MVMLLRLLVIRRYDNGASAASHRGSTPALFPLFRQISAHIFSVHFLLLFALFFRQVGALLPTAFFALGANDFRSRRIVNGGVVPQVGRTSVRLVAHFARERLRIGAIIITAVSG